MMSTAHMTSMEFAAHTQEGHPENASRVAAIAQYLQNSDLLSGVLDIQPRLASEDELLVVHDSSYLQHLSATARRGGRFDMDTYLTPQSEHVARLAAGGVLALVDAVIDGRAENGAAAVRPPGHHAGMSRGMGFCLLNNVAVAARYIQRQFGLGRVAIVDIDVHHGNGTQDILYDDPSILYISTHQSPLFPGTGRLHEIGRDDAKGSTVNIPLPPGAGDTAYRLMMETVVIPVLQRFQPEFLFVSAGFDAHWRDPLANMRLTLAGYDALIRMLVRLAGDQCEGRIAVILEGGYDLQVLATGWGNVIRVLRGKDEYDDPFGPPPGSEADVGHVHAQLLRVHQLY